VPERPALIDVRWAANFTLCPLYPVCLIPAAFHGLRLAGHLVDGLGARRDAAPDGQCAPLPLRANAGRMLSAALRAAATITELGGWGASLRNARAASSRAAGDRPTRQLIDAESGAERRVVSLSSRASD
jgi:hypothetical protein